MSKRVCCLYRVSTGKQVDYDSNNEADIPMQRKACHKFANEMGWDIVHEEQEDGVSGHKVRAENRDKIQIIKDLARKKKFDILLVFMFDRIGRIADETPFVVEWFVKNGIEVWSTQEGEQSFDNHIDKLLNYIRFWQADGESEKTSVRTKTSLGQLVEAGHFKGGVAAFGYDLVKSGRFNKRKHELYDLKVNPDEAIVVKIIFDKYTQEGYGAHRITTWLNNNGYRARTGKMWHEATIRGILCNLTYTGVLRSGDARSEVIPELQIIPPEQFERARMIMQERSDRKKENPTVPLNTKGKSLVSGKVDYSKEFENLTILKSEVIKAIKGESSFSADTLSELIVESEKECSRLFDLVSDAEKDVADGESVLKTLSDSFDELISWAELYDEASFEKKKMIVNCLIKRVEVSRGYNLKVEFNIDFQQFMVGLDKVA